MRTILLAAAVVGAIIVFQNCGGDVPSGKPLEPSDGSSHTAPFDPVIKGPVGTENFKRGELFNYDFVPNKSQMVQTMVEVFNYSNHIGAKAIAVTASGLGFVTRKAIGQQNDANQSALEACYVISGGQPCTLLALGENFNVSRSTMANTYTFTLQDPTNVTQIPFVPIGVRSQLANEYMSASSPKALAVSLDGAYSWVANTPQFPILSAQEAARVAMERCEMMAAFSPCTLFATNDEVVFKPKQMNRVPVIEYLRLSMGNNIPGMRDQVFTAQMTNDYLPNVIQNNRFGAIYITADGRGGYAVTTSAAAADMQAQAACNANKMQFPCFKYAENQVVQNISSNLEAIVSYSMQTHCKSVPRQTCAHHRQMGCPPGSYYTLTSGSIALENCL